jgi:Co/Zn/Cd efflux system component
VVTRLTMNLASAVLFVALANLGYFFVEFGVANHIGSVSLFADSVDFLEDAAINFLIFFALSQSARSRAKIGMILAFLILLPGAAALWTAWTKFHSPIAPDPELLSLTGFGALLINVGCAFLLAKFKHHGGSLTRAAFLSARNDAIANIAIIGAGVATALTKNASPDLIVGLGIAIMNLGAAKEVWDAARKEWSAFGA